MSECIGEGCTHSSHKTHVDRRSSVAPPSNLDSFDKAMLGPNYEFRLGENVAVRGYVMCIVFIDARGMIVRIAPPSTDTCTCIAENLMNACESCAQMTARRFKNEPRRKDKTFIKKHPFTIEGVNGAFITVKPVHSSRAPFRKVQ